MLEIAMQTDKQHEILQGYKLSLGKFRVYHKPLRPITTAKDGHPVASTFLYAKSDI